MRSRWPNRSPRWTARTARACAWPAACRLTRARTTTRRTTSTRVWRPFARSDRTARTDESGTFAVDSALGAAPVPATLRAAGPRGHRALRHTTQGAHDLMGVPKRRVSHARQGERRSHLAIDLPNLEEC